MPVKNLPAGRIFFLSCVETRRFFQTLAKLFDLIFPCRFLYLILLFLCKIGLCQFIVPFVTVPLCTFSIAGNTLIFSRFQSCHGYIALISIPFPIRNHHRISGFHCNIHQLAAGKRSKMHAYTLPTDLFSGILSGSRCDQLILINRKNISFCSIQIRCSIGIICCVFCHLQACDYNFFQVNSKSNRASNLK